MAQGLRLPRCMPKQLRYRSLVAWQRADDLFIRLHRLAKEVFPLDERFVLGTQLRRAALSVPANIVEGTARSHHRDTVHFLRISWSSLAEVGYYVHVARRLGYTSDETTAALERQVRQVAAPLMGLIRSEERRGRTVRLRRKSDPQIPSPPGSPAPPDPQPPRSPAPQIPRSPDPSDPQIPSPPDPQIPSPPDPPPVPLTTIHPRM